MMVVDEELKEQILLSFFTGGLPTGVDVSNYDVYTEEEADIEAKERILQSLWAFNPSFLADYTDIEEIVFEAIQANGRCEDNNEAILSLVGVGDYLPKHAIKQNGRGIFLGGFDDSEKETAYEGTTYLIYRNT